MDGTTIGLVMSNEAKRNETSHTLKLRFKCSIFRTVIVWEISHFVRNEEVLYFGFITLLHIKLI